MGFRTLGAMVQDGIVRLRTAEDFKNEVSNLVGGHLSRLRVSGLRYAQLQLQLFQGGATTDHLETYVLGAPYTNFLS